MDDAVDRRPELRLGVRLAEVEALYAAALTAGGDADERRLCAELAAAAAALAASARAAARGRPEPRPAPARRAAPRHRTRLERRLSAAERTADRIVARARRGPG
ncbi:hypothetical protein [Actinomadura parmotrematis]|uniref:Uncharacterized protein n=1 Tax=Actinomadura parmotrematis TaxID=2864039 RepID=A0ABS7G658_9ACTN|nr:hypothetical protein [Actinomadura parmotrematis]MBW8487359.1 hypothetical protein [Actinomadura parmotrematis]